MPAVQSDETEIHRYSLAVWRLVRVMTITNNRWQFKPLGYEHLCEVIMFKAIVSLFKKLNRDASNETWCPKKYNEGLLDTPAFIRNKEGKHVNH